jgi:hypothetical protein
MEMGASHAQIMVKELGSL